MDSTGLARFKAQHGEELSPEMRAALQALEVRTDDVPRQAQPLDALAAATDDLEKGSAGSLALGASASTLGASLVQPHPAIAKACLQSVVENRAVTAAAKSMMEQAVAKSAVTAERNSGI